MPHTLRSFPVCEHSKLTSSSMFILKTTCSFHALSNWKPN